MAESDSNTDKRKRITPEVFEVDSSLLDIPLATPKRRLLALLIDLFAIGVFSTFGFSFLCLFLAVIFSRAHHRAKKIPEEQRQNLMRHNPKLMLIVAAFCWFTTLLSFSFQGFDSPFSFDSKSNERSFDGGLAIADILSKWKDFEGADPSEKTEIANEIVSELATAGMSEEDMEDIISEVAENSIFSDDAISELRAAKDKHFSQTAIPAKAVMGSMSTAELAQNYIDLVDKGGTEEEIENSHNALKESLAGEELNKLKEQNKTYREKLREEKSKKRGWGYSILELLKNAARDLGFTVGWSMFYFTTLPAFFRGKTIGKRLLGLQVIRLDGKPLSLWNTFERGGAYSAGLATGLLGFAQIYWDPNRQAIQDKIAGTAVIRIQNKAFVK